MQCERLVALEKKAALLAELVRQQEAEEEEETQQQNELASNAVSTAAGQSGCEVVFDDVSTTTPVCVIDSQVQLEHSFDALSELHGGHAQQTHQFPF